MLHELAFFIVTSSLSNSVLSMSTLSDFFGMYLSVLRTIVEAEDGAGSTAFLVVPFTDALGTQGKSH